MTPLIALCMLLVSTASAEVIRVSLQRTALEVSRNATVSKLGRPSYRIRQAVARQSLEAYMKDIAYFGAVSVGNPPKSFRIDFDTGSANTWISSTLCQTTACMGHRRFNPDESTTFRNDGRRFLVQYGDGSSVNGVLGRDDINIGGVLLRGQSFGLAQSESDEMDDQTIDGIMGLAFSELNAVSNAPTVLDTMIDQRLLDAPIFSFHLSRGDANTQSTGEIIFGGIDASRFQSPMRFAPVTRPLYWQFHVDQVYIGGKSLKLSSDAVVDTGTSLIVVPSDIARQLHTQIPGSFFSPVSGWLLPCNLSSTGPALEFEMAGGKSTVPSVDYVGPALTMTPEMCFSNIMNSEVEHWILGDTFLKNNYVVFDYGNRRIGFAHRTDETKSPQKKPQLAQGSRARSTSRRRGRDYGRVASSPSNQVSSAATQKAKGGR
ncbi:aspartic peptidase domain-containing protein [Thamnocephalis sphaerospora]|uniref:rhizopuspepsin n=1 Tax=Thamnocephalis sphaerospora TaxID=78915 RepID=A0A4P9XYL0_9FUNG|nr:aspartic peptidase domain-containing protein [Thamnocephalis sphaerospora]|eukprot:RKP10791.1 aspartic peptidase domain-containing protein [Thamnocephalis sphaerospora]